MAIGETLLKISDYPFAYSIALLFLRMKGIDLLSPDATPFLLAAGIGATILVVADPIGRPLKWWLMDMGRKRTEKRRDDDKILKSWKVVSGAFHTQPIEKEKDKIVNTVYFLIFISLLAGAVSDVNFYSSHFSILYKNNQSCELKCSQVNTYFAIVITGIIIAGFGAWNAIKIFKKADIMAVYLYCKNSNSVSPSSIQSISDFVKMGDWETAQSWREKITTEYLQEEGQRREREERLRNHIQPILNQFNDFKKKCDSDNRANLLNPSFTLSENPKHHSVEEMFKEFPLYDVLIEHLYTNDNHDIFDSFFEYLKLRFKMKQTNEQWENEKNSGIDEIIKGLSIKITEKRTGGIRGENGQFVNINLIKKEIDRFLEFELTELRPIQKKIENPELYQVRFFDSSSSDFPRDDILAELYKQDAEKLSVELATLATKLSESAYYSRTDIESMWKIQDVLEQRIEQMLTSFSIMGDPLRGSCQYCRNERFFNKETILQHEKLLQVFPKQELDKETIKPKYNKREPKDAIKK